MSRTAPAADGHERCTWCLSTPEYVAYHDDEWGRPVDDDRRLFEKLSLEAFQSGLSWRTILAKREGFRQALHRFDFARVARYTAKDVERLLADEGIVRHRGKIEATINNAQRALELVDEAGSLAAFVWSFEPPAPEGGPELASTSAASTALSKALKKRGWSFVGPTTVHAFMQAAGLINDHAPACRWHAVVEDARQGFRRPRLRR